MIFPACTLAATARPVCNLDEIKCCPHSWARTPRILGARGVYYIKFVRYYNGIRRLGGGGSSPWLPACPGLVAPLFSTADNYFIIQSFKRGWEAKERTRNGDAKFCILYSFSHNHVLKRYFSSHPPCKLQGFYNFIFKYKFYILCPPPPEN